MNYTELANKRQGLRHKRISENIEHGFNKTEESFHNEWSSQKDFLKGILGKEPSNRDEVVAATVVQWLGSNVGMAFVEKALNNAGIVITTGKSYAENFRRLNKKFGI